MIDHKIIKRCQAGDREAQRHVYQDTSERLYRLILRIVRNESDAFDVAQDTYVRAFTQIGKFDERSSFYTWLCRIAVNEALQFRRREIARTRREAAVGRISHSQNDNSVDARLDIEAALAQLSIDDRAILLLRYQEGLDYQTIATITGCESGTVGSRLTRARERIRAILRREYAEGEEIAVGEHPISRTIDEADPEGLATRSGIQPGGVP